MTLIDFLLHKTSAEELCVICDPWRIATVWIDHEDLFSAYIDNSIRNREVEKDEWDDLEIIASDGIRHYISAHYIYIK